MNYILYTDYPIEGLPEGVHAVILCAYDRDKYASVRAVENGAPENIKRGYLWQDRELTKPVSKVMLERVPTRVGLPAPTRREIAEERRKERHSWVTEYRVFMEADTQTYRCKSLKDAMRRLGVFGRRGTAHMIGYRHTKSLWSSSTMMTVEDGVVYRYHSRSRDMESAMKVRHVNMVNRWLKGRSA